MEIDLKSTRIMAGPMRSGPIRVPFNIERMNKALAASRVRMPKDMSPHELYAWIRKANAEMHKETLIALSKV